ncbi:hypothetical protein CAC42_7509 [Sphaceloma murrayae]|uniref:Altered inheritance of mitochondria protein 11 n=1 Tax=Sphaceloma murrayae TaxID=2082308 RepID=A0A2K1QX77_9PEZI|nr:hypothetical protein CAC42_7509 [Sphaceloma murrayae]
MVHHLFRFQRYNSTSSICTSPSLLPANDTWMWWPFSLPEPHDARVLSGRLNGAAQGDSTPIKHRSYSDYTPPQPEHTPRWYTLWASPRSWRQFSYFALGAGLLMYSSVITRRALARKYLSIKPKGMFSPSNKVEDANGQMDAVEALSLATLNVTSFGVMMVGGGLWAFDISSLEELRARVRMKMDIDGHGKSEAETEEDIEEWMGVVLARLQGKGEKDIAEMVKQANEKGISNKS